MALTFRHWCLALLLGALVIGVAYLPPGSIEESARWIRWGTIGGVRAPRARLAAAAEQWGRLAEVETLRRSPGAGSDPEVLFRSEAPPEVKQLADSLVRGFWYRAPRADSTIRLRVILWPRAGHLDVGTAQEQTQVLLPDQTDGRTCLVLVPDVYAAWGERNPSSQWRSVFRRAVAPALAPCLLRAAMGEPGPAVGRWLRGRGYDLALSIDWAVGGNLRQEFWGYDELTERPPELLAVVSRLIGQLPPAYAAAPDGIACIGGAEERCMRAVTAVRYRDSTAARIVIPSAFGYRRSSLGSSQHRFISDLIRERGLEAFRNFWASSKPVPDAFAEAYREPLSAWTRQWMIRNSGGVDLGAGFHAVGTLSGLIAAALLVGLAAWGALRREVG